MISVLPWPMMSLILGPKQGKHLDIVLLVLLDFHTSFNGTFRVCVQQFMDPAVGLEAIQQMTPESKVLDRMIHHWARKILDRVDDHSAENASKVGPVFAHHSKSCINVGLYWVALWTSACLHVRMRHSLLGGKPPLPAKFHYCKRNHWISWRWYQIPSFAAAPLQCSPSCILVITNMGQIVFQETCHTRVIEIILCL